MVNQQIAQDIIRYGQSLSIIGPETLTTGFLTNQYRNHIDKEQAVELVQQSEYIIRELVKQLEASNAVPDDYECRVLFQYVFDKVAEATYKTLVGEEVDTELNINEAFDYHEPDLPYYIQQKITNAVGQIVTLCSRALEYIEENDYRSDDIEEWFLPLLLLPVSLSLQFVLEMDLDDDSELRQFLGEE